MKRIVLIAVLASGLQGCAWGMRTVADIENVDMVSAEPLFQKANGWSLISNSSIAVQNLRGNPDRCDYRVPKKEGEACAEASFLGLRNKARDADALLNSAATGTVEADAARLSKRYFDAGATLSDVLCDEWFDRISRSSVAMAQSRDTLTNTSLAATGVMAAARTAAVTVSIVTAALGFGSKTANDLSNNYLLAPDLGELVRKMKNYRATYRALIEANPSISKYQFATAELYNYHSTCSIAWARAYVNLAVKASGPTGGGMEGTAAGVGFQQLAAELAAYFKSDLKATDAENYYALYFADVLKNKNSDALKKALTDAKLITGIDETTHKPKPDLKPDAKSADVDNALVTMRATWGGVLDPVATTAGAAPTTAGPTTPSVTTSPNVGSSNSPAQN